jgi:catechol 2,3-dioxygenase-like lactoylglutathione lyase family enzyme
VTSGAEETETGMTTRFDHFVIAVHDLAEAAADYRALGFNVVDGGEHADGKSRNVLIAFQDGAYLEIIAFTEPLAGTTHRWARALEHGEGMVTYALRVEDLANAVARVRERGLAFAVPSDGGRLRPDGQRAVWRSARPASEDETPLPFLIEDVADHALRVPAGDDAVHPNGVTGVVGLRETVADLDVAETRYRSLLDTAAAPVSQDHDARGNAICFRLGSAWLELSAPATEANPGRNRSELVLGASSATDPDRLLPLDATHGARIRIALT